MDDVIKGKGLNCVNLGSVYIKRPEIDAGTANNVSDVIRIACEVYASIEGYARMWYRGVADADWPLCPRLPTTYSLGSEGTMYQDFKSGSHIRHEKCPPDSDHGAWLSLMQHHGLPTRLLDWTGSLLVAAYFVVWRDRNEPELMNRPGAIWMTPPGILNGNLTGLNSIFELGDRHLASLLHGTGKRTNLMCACVPGRRDIRMMVQHGAFTVHDNETPLDQIPNAIKALRRIVIPRESRQLLAAELELCGFNRASLFPDVDNLAAHIKLATPRRQSIPNLAASEQRVKKDGKWFATDPPPFRYPDQTDSATVATHARWSMENSAPINILDSSSDATQTTI